jgi:endonuclease/exonuclease/phosphatase family metal-dependent hydrolase
MTLKLLTLNIWHDRSPWPERVKLIRQWIKRLAPDLIGFREVLMGENGFPPIILGDFNAEPGSDEIRYMTGLHSLQGRSVAFLDVALTTSSWAIPGARAWAQSKVAASSAMRKREVSGRPTTSVSLRSCEPKTVRSSVVERPM